MTEPDSKFEEEIRRALCTAGDLVVPAGDGLQKIRGRAVYRRHPLAWLFADAAHLLTRPFGWLRVAASELAATARGHSSLAPRLRGARSWPRAMLAGLRSPAVWLRPVLAATATLAIVLAVTLAFPRLRNQVASFSGLSNGPSQGLPGSGGGTAYGSGSGSPQSSGSSSLAIRVTPGQPVDALMLPLSSSRCRSAVPAHSGQVPYIPPAPGPGPAQTVGAGPVGAGTVAPQRVNAAAAAGPVGVRAIAQTSPCARSASPTTMPASTPPTLPVTTPPTTTPTSPPTSPPVTTTPPTSPPVTTTPPTTPPTTTTSDGTSSPSPPGTASPG